MRFIRNLLYAGLILSVMLNVLLYLRNDKRRMQFRVNNKTFSKKEFYDWMEQHHGTETEAAMVKYYLITQAAEKAGVKPDSKEIEEIVTSSVEQNPTTALEIKMLPWKKADLEMGVEQSLALANLMTKDVKASDDQVQSYYQNNGSAKWDEPTKLYTRMLICQNMTSATRAKELVDQMAAQSHEVPGATKDVPTMRPVPDISVVEQNLAPDVYLFPQRAISDGKKLFLKPVSQNSPEPLVNKLASMKVGESIIVPNGAGAFAVVYLEGIRPGWRTSLTDPAIRKKVERDFKLTQSTLAEEVLRSLWDTADIQTDPEAKRAILERMILPDRTNRANQQKPGK